MKRIFIAGLTSILFFTACHNNGSSTVGTYDDDATSSSADKKEDAMKAQADSTQNKEVTEDTGKNTVGVVKDSTSSSHKDTSFASEKKNVKVQKTKKIEIILKNGWNNIAKSSIDCT